MPQSYTLHDKRTDRTYQMPWDGPEPPSQEDAQNYIFDQETRGPISRGLDDVESGIGKVENFLGKHKEGINNFLFGRSEVPDIFHIKPTTLQDLAKGKTEDTLPVAPTESESLLPEATGATSTIGKLGQGFYNYLIRPLGSPSGFLGAG